jgi:hypothetical protein
MLQAFQSEMRNIYTETGGHCDFPEERLGSYLLY